MVKKCTQCEEGLIRIKVPGFRGGAYKCERCSILYYSGNKDCKLRIKNGVKYYNLNS